MARDNRGAINMKRIGGLMSTAGKVAYEWSFWGWAARVADPCSKWAQVLAVGGTAAWAIFTFNLFGTSTITPTLKVSASVLPYDTDHRLLVVRVKPGNVGRVPLDISDQPMSIAIKEIPAGHETGYVNRDDLKPLYVAQNIIGRYKGGYELDPGVEFDEVEPFVVPAGRTYVVEATLSLDEGTDIRTPEVVYVPAVEITTAASGKS
ncbi:hypothetical protein EGJ54_24510 [Pandoraea apista]|nr:hypothetical protein AT395_11405 [Pandoraea apista]RRW88828.1 hypothetical protein EGJ54_24510 [Pandoraea apista]RRW98087.1 hypothetical protein EGJ56_23920 [Pandoraea apista]